LAALLCIALAGVLVWTRKKNKERPIAELEGEKRETIHEVDGYVKPSEMDAKETQVGPAIHEMSSEQELQRHL
jgi:hypothetical protein